MSRPATTTTPADGSPVEDAARRAGLARMKAVATGLFLAALAVFVGCVALGPDTGAWVGYVRATAEASMVGALADWFAVTALFRHPLGLPIPHTAIIPRKKDQIGASLGTFVQSNFLSPQVLGAKLAGLGLARRGGEWLAEEQHAARVGANLGAAVTGMSAVLRDEDVQATVSQLVEGRLRATPVAPILAQVLDIALDGNHHQDILGAGLRGLSRFLDENRAVFRDKVAEESPEWVPVWVDDRVFAKLFGSVQSFLAEVGADAHHELRGQFDRKLRAYVVALRTDPELIGKVETLKNQVLDHPAVRDWSESLWGGFKTTLVELADDPDSELRRRLTAGLMHAGRTLATDTELQAKVDGWAVQIALYLAEQYADDIAELVSGTVARWDAEDTSRRIELQVGRDLQFIRINGTIVGGLAGLVIYTVAQLFG